VTGHLQHEELARLARLERAPPNAEQGVRANRLRAGDPKKRALQDRAPVAACRSWSDSARSLRAFAIACTAAAAPEMVVMHGTRATSAASRMRYPSARAPDP
jgi:hypothetical protein